MRVIYNDPMLVEYTRLEPILTPEERDAALAVWRSEFGRRQMNRTARNFWKRLPRHRIH